MKLKKYTYYTLQTILIVIVTISGFKLINYYNEGNRINKQISDIEAKVVISDTNDGQVYNGSLEENEKNQYWDYIKMNLIDVNFDELKKINNDVKGWIKVEGTSINYPFVQTSDNSYYLTHSFDKSRNSAGWVFIDYRNNLNDKSEKNTILYAHGRIDKTMFGSLKNIFANNWLNNKNNYIVRLSTESENTLWQVFSIYKIATTNDYIKTIFESDFEYEKFLNMLLQRSNYNFDTVVNINDRILTLSTCYDKETKVVMHAKLIKHQIKINIE